MDQEIREHFDSRIYPDQNGLMGRAHHWAISCCCLCLLACSIGPDRVGVGVGRSFGSGSHLATSGGGSDSGSSRESLRDARNGDIDSAWVYGEWDLKPQKVQIVQQGPWSYLDETPLYRKLEPDEPKDPGPPVIILDHGAHQDPDDEADILAKGLKAVADTEWSTIEKILYLSLILSLLFGVFFGFKFVIKKR